METMLGIKITHVVAGFAGGVVRAFMVGHTFWTAISSVVIGALTAGYLTTPIFRGITEYISIPEDTSTEHAVSFLVGLCAMLICDGILHVVKTWSDEPRFSLKRKPKE